MRKWVAGILVFLFVLSLSAAAFAGGGGPSGNFKKGIITEVDEGSRTVLFTALHSQEKMTLKVADSVDMGGIEMNKKVMVNLKDLHGEKVVSSVNLMFVDLAVKRFLFMIFVGLAGGLLSGFIGSGGAFVMTPAMMSIGTAGAIAVASNMCHKFPKSMVGGYKRWKYGQADLKLGIIMAISAIIGVQLGVLVQRRILNAWGEAGSNLYVSLAYVVILVIVGSYVFFDAWKLSRGGEEVKTSGLAKKLQSINLPPMIHFRRANIRISLWFTLPVGFGAGLLAATIGVGGFIGVPGMIYIVGASAIVASASELILAFIMGLTGSMQWAFAGLVDIRLTILLLAGSLFGVQLGALGTTYVKDYMVKIVMGAVMLIVAVSRGLMVPVYLNKLGFTSLAGSTTSLLDKTSFVVLSSSLVAAVFIIVTAMAKGMKQERQEERAVETTAARSA